MFTSPLFQIKLHLLNTVLLSRFQSSPGWWGSNQDVVRERKREGEGGRKTKASVWGTEISIYCSHIAWSNFLYFSICHHLCYLSDLVFTFRDLLLLRNFFIVPKSGCPFFTTLIIAFTHFDSSVQRDIIPYRLHWGYVILFAPTHY